MKKVNIAINGFGRIGRNVTRQLSDKKNVNLVAINSRSNASSHAYLLKYDSVYGTFGKKIEHKKDKLIVNGTEIAVLQYDNPSDIPWRKYNADLIIE